MSKFYCVVNSKSSNSDDKTTAGLLEKACHDRGIEFVNVDSESFDFSDPPELETGSALYRVSIDPASSMVFRLLVAENVATVYQNLLVAMSQRITSALTHQKFGLPVIPTIFDLPRDREKLKKSVDTLGGFPIIIKAVGGSHGVGVMRADSFESLASMADYLNGQTGRFIMRKYIDFEHHARLNVLDGKVIDSVIYERPENDFRTNVSGIRVRGHRFGDEIEDTAVRSVQALCSDFGGVDILIDKSGKGFLAEVNIPCFFPRTQMATGVDTAGMLVEHLVKKGIALAA
ncbi:MAG TPA: hypothetical protein VG964_02625 [Candidatus Saccharimonadales bacterium]|nr:hypothetical protein [Candidatus Saccharimonadales bacterium]